MTEPSVMLIIRHIGVYHNARLYAASKELKSFTVLSVANDSNFSEFMGDDAFSFSVKKLYFGRQAYQAAIASGRVDPDIKQCLNDCNPDVVVISGWASPESRSAISWAKLNRRRIVVMSESQKHDAQRSLFREFVKRSIVKMCDSALVGGETHREYVAELGLSPNGVFLGYDVVDNAHFRMQRRDLPSLSDLEWAARLSAKKYFVMSARLIAKKNVETAIRAFAAAQSHMDKGTRLLILGDGPERNELEHLKDALALNDNVIFAGFCRYPDLPTLYANSIALVHVSTVEQWGLVINEACASGVPVISSSACGATAELVQHGINGFVVTARDENCISKAMIALESMPKERYAAFCKASERIVDQWTPERFGSGLRAAVLHAFEAPYRPASLTNRLLLWAGRTHTPRLVE